MIMESPIVKGFRIAIAGRPMSQRQLKETLLPKSVDFRGVIGVDDHLNIDVSTVLFVENVVGIYCANHGIKIAPFSGKF